MHAHRPLPADSELAQAIAVLARAQQDAVWDRTQAHNRLRSHLREYYPGFLAAFAAAAASCAPKPGPSWPPPLPLPPPPRTRAGDGPPGPGPAAPPGHRLAGIITSFPGLGALTGARVLAETGDDRSRFTDANGLKAYAGAAPITRASGKTLAVLHRRVKNQRLAAAGYSWAFSAISASPGARHHYDKRKNSGDRHAAAQRNLFGCLHHCLATGQHYNETVAFPSPGETTREIAA